MPKILNPSERIGDLDRCICCGASSWRRYCRVANYDLSKCRACGFVRVNLPEAFDLTTLYGVDYFFGRGFDSSQLIPEARQPNPAYVARRRYWLRLLADAGGGPGRLLDVGCGAGALLDVARDMGWNAEGQEIAAAGAAEAQMRGHPVQLGELPSCEYEAGSFDAATMIEVIEHVRDPRPMLSALSRALRPGGWLLITTGDIGSLGARFLGGSWSYLRPPGHVSYFTQRALVKVLTLCGFVHVRAVPTYNLAYPSFPGRHPARSPIAKSPALFLRHLTRMEQCTIAQRR